MLLVSSTHFYLFLHVPLQEHTMAREHSQTDGRVWWCHIFEWGCSSHLPLSSLPSDQTAINSTKWGKERLGMGKVGSVKLFCLPWNPISLWSPWESHIPSEATIITCSEPDQLSTLSPAPPGWLMTLSRQSAVIWRFAAGRSGCVPDLNV